MTLAQRLMLAIALCVLPGCVSFEAFVERDTSVDLVPSTCNNGVQDGGEAGVDCGGFCQACDVPPVTCQSCEPPCAPESDAVFCARVSSACGGASAVDNCGVARVVASCGTCAAVPSVACVSGVCTCNVSPELDAELCETAHRSCGTFNVVDRCGVARAPNCGGCPGARSCLANGDCTPLCPALPLSEGSVNGERIWSYDATAAPRWLRIDNTRGILHAANSDLSTIFVEFVRNPLVNTSSACGGTPSERFFFFVDFVGGTYRFSLAGTAADLQAAGFGNAGDQTYTVTTDGNTIVGVSADRTTFLQRTRTSAHGAANVTWAGAPATFGSIVGANLSQPVFAPGDSWFFYVQQPAAVQMQMRSTRAGDGSYPNGVDISADVTINTTLHLVDSLSADLLTMLATTPSLSTRVFSRPNRWSAFAPVGTTGDTVSGFRTRLNGDCTVAATTCEGGCANERVCLMQMRGCVPETDEQMCARLGADCTVTAQDLCYRDRTVVCGACTGGAACSRSGHCVNPTPAAPVITTQSVPTPDPSGVYEVKLYLPQPAGDVLLDERFFLLGATADRQTLLVYRGCDVTSGDYYFADRFDATNYRYRLARIASGAELMAAGLAVVDNVMTLMPDGLSFLTANATRTAFVRWSRPSVASSFVFTPEAVRVFDGFAGVSAGQNIGFPVLSYDGRFFAYTQEGPSRRIFFTESTTGGFFRDSSPASSGVEITSSLTNAYAPTGISPDGLTLFATNGTQTFLFRRSSFSMPFSSAFSPVGAPTPYVGNHTRPTLLGGVQAPPGAVFAMRAAALCADERIVVNTITP